MGLVCVRSNPGQGLAQSLYFSNATGFCLSDNLAQPELIFPALQVAACLMTDLTSKPLNRHIPKNQKLFFDFLLDFYGQREYY